MNSSSKDLVVRHKASGKQRSQSASPITQSAPNLSLCNPKEQHDIVSADIYSWKLKKESDGVIYCVYCVHVILKSGLKWIIDKRYRQFRELRKEMKLIKPELSSVKFPKKNWFFNLSKKYLKSRQTALNNYIHQIIGLSPQPLEISIVFLFVKSAC